MIILNNRGHILVFQKEKTVDVHYDIQPSVFNLTEEGRFKIQKLYYKYATPKSCMTLGKARSGRFEKMPKETMENITEELKEILENEENLISIVTEE
jgi:hypothetical protein